MLPAQPEPYQAPISDRRYVGPQTPRHSGRRLFEASLVLVSGARVVGTLKAGQLETRNP